MTMQLHELRLLVDLDTSVMSEMFGAVIPLGCITVTHIPPRIGGLLSELIRLVGR
jgi:hypothetical protein